MDGFELRLLRPIFLHLDTNSIVIMTDGSREQEESLENAELDLFRLDKETCLQHMDWILAELKKQTQDQVILGAIMFSSLYHATLLHLGFYAESEMGPPAVAGHEHVFQRGRAARAAVQDNTAVIAVFLVPAIETEFNEPESSDLDDSDANVIAFVHSRLGVSVV